jgi:hypothetical protein
LVLAFIAYMRRVGIYFALPDAKQVGLLKLLLERHGIVVETRSCEMALDSPFSTNDFDLLLLGISARARLERCFHWCVEPTLRAKESARVIRMDETSPAVVDSRLRSLQSYDFSADGLTALFGDLNTAFLPMSRVRSFDDRRGDDERRTWNLQRYRYGLWLAFSRTTGAGKFDPYPLTLSKRIKTTEALVGEVSSYRYVDPTTHAPIASDRVLSDALQSVWDNTAELAPNAIHVIEATAEEIWNRYSPSMASRQRTA